MEVHIKMTIMDAIRRFTGRNDELKAKMAEVAQNRKVEKTLDDREKSSNERELESHINEAREAHIKEQLDIIRKKKQHEHWTGNNLLKSGTSILHEDSPILKQKNIFKGNKNIFKEKGMFFK